MYVYHDCAESKSVPILRGVPQGSALGPSLFLVYFNDVAAALSCSRCIRFADDTALFVSAPTHNEVVQKLTAVLSELKHYFDTNKLSLNVRKTQCLFPYETDTGSDVLYDGRRLDVVSSFKYLELYIDSALTWRVHIDHVISKVKCKLYLMYR
jgi:hypothetical protein